VGSGVDVTVGMTGDGSGIDVTGTQADAMRKISTGSAFFTRSLLQYLLLT